MNTEESVRLLVRTGSYVMGEKEVRELIICEGCGDSDP